MTAAVVLFPIFARAHMLRTGGGIVDVSPEPRRSSAAPHIAICSSIAAGAQADSKPHRRRLVPGRHHRPRRTAPLLAPFSLDRFVTGALVDEHGAAAVAH
jgi:sarcosine oxidase subunit beta